MCLCICDCRRRKAEPVKRTSSWDADISFKYDRSFVGGSSLNASMLREEENIPPPPVPIAAASFLPAASSTERHGVCVCVCVLLW